MTSQSQLHVYEVLHVHWSGALARACAIVRIALAAIVMSCPAFSAADTLFLMRDGDAPYLRYLSSVVNRYDRASVIYTLGEIELVGPKASRRVAFDDSVLVAREGMLNANMQGVQRDLLPYARSHVFVLDASETTITFFRSLSMSNVDTLLQRTSAWRCPDRTEYAIRLVRAQDDSVLAVVDSVGIDSTLTASNALKTYGTHVDRWCREYTVAAQHRGIPVYLQLVPKRWGPTPNGVALASVQKTFSESVYYSCGQSTPDSARWVALRSRLLDRFLAFAAASWASNCAVPPPPPVLLTAGFTEEYNRRYFDIVTHQNAEVLVRKECPNAKSSAPNQPTSPRLHGIKMVMGRLDVCIATSSGSQVEVDVTEVTTGRPCLRTVLTTTGGTQCFSFPVGFTSGR